MVGEVAAFQPSSLLIDEADADDVVVVRAGHLPLGHRASGLDLLNPLIVRHRGGEGEQVLALRAVFVAVFLL